MARTLKEIKATRSDAEDEFRTFVEEINILSRRGHLKFNDTIILNERIPRRN